MYPKFIFQDVDKEETTKQHQNCIRKILQIRKPDNKIEGVSLTKGTEKILLPSFSMLILGKPGSGKSHFIAEIINQSCFYKGKFDRIVYIGPTKYEDVIHDDYNTSLTLDMKFIDKKISQCQGWAENMLIIMDDVVSQIPTSLRSRMQELFFNRRHQLKNGTISIIITSQKLTTVPTWIRATVNCLVSFAISKSEINTLFNQIPLIENAQAIKNKFMELLKHEFIYFNLQTGTAYDYNFQFI